MTNKKNDDQKIKSRISWYLKELGIPEPNPDEKKVIKFEKTFYLMNYYFYKLTDETKCLLVIAVKGEFNDNNDLLENISNNIQDRDLITHFEKVLEKNVLLLSSSNNIDLKKMEGIKNELCKKINDWIKTSNNNDGNKTSNDIKVKKENIYLDYLFPMEKKNMKSKLLICLVTIV